MVIAGVEWFDKNKNKKPVFKEFSNITGVICDENEDAKELSGHMAKAANDDFTGAMMQASINHVLYAVKNGWNQYIIDMETKV